MQDNQHNKHLEDLGWDQMRRLLDKEMPVRRRFVLWWWLLPALLLLGVSGAAGWNYLQQTEEKQPALQEVPKAPLPAPHPEPENPAREYAARSKPATGQAKGLDKDVADRLAQGGTSAAPQEMVPRKSAASNAGAERSGHASSSPQPTIIAERPIANPVLSGDGAALPEAEGYAVEAFSPLASVAFSLPSYSHPFSLTAPVIAQKRSSPWAWYAEAGWITQPGSGGGGLAGLGFSRRLSPRLRLSAGLSAGQFQSVLRETTESMPELKQPNAQPSFGTSQSSDPPAIKEYFLQSSGLFMPLSLHYRLTTRLELEGGLHAGWMFRHVLAQDASSSADRVGGGISSAGEPSPFLGPAGTQVANSAFAPFILQAQLGAGYLLNTRWSVHAAYRLGLNEWVRTYGVQSRSDYLSLSLRRMF